MRRGRPSRRPRPAEEAEGLTAVRRRLWLDQEAQVLAGPEAHLSSILPDVDPGFRTVRMLAFSVDLARSG